MPSLILIKTPIHPPPVSEVELVGEAHVVIGRDARNAQIVINDKDSVSRTHCRITQQDGAFLLEDLGSRNHTFLLRTKNRTRLEAHKPVALKPDDLIEICDFVFQFHHEEEAPIELVATHDFLIAPAERLRFLMTLSSDPARSAELDPLLKLVADTLFNTNLTKTFDLDFLLEQVIGTLLAVFRGSSRGLLLMPENGGGRPVPRVVRGPAANPDEPRYNRSIVRHTLDTVKAHLATERLPTGPRSLMCTPLATSEGGTLGAILLETRDPHRPFDTEDLHLFAILGNLASVAIDRALVHEEARARAVVQNQIDLARRVLLGFLPQNLPEVAGYEFYAHYSPAQTVGGDYYDFVQLPGGRLAVVLGDVAGKGVPAALLVAKLSSEVRYSLLSQPDPAAAVSLLNNQMINGGMANKFVTLALMVLDPVRHSLTVVNAGHNSPRLYSISKRTLRPVISVPASGLPIGIQAGYHYQSVTVSLEPSDTLVTYTDGVTDAMDKHDRIFGSDVADQHLTPSQSAGPDAARPRRMGEFLINAVRRHTEGRNPTDDIAIVCFGRWDPDSDPGTTLTGKIYDPGQPL
jgi:serine phosphatase RsbU (regulator of sigma subunit)/pSer/pThr/pTyr-binding forkhead associated (FHA) protein